MQHISSASDLFHVVFLLLFFLFPFSSLNKERHRCSWAKKENDLFVGHPNSFRNGNSGANPEVVVIADQDANIGLRDKKGELHV